MSRSLPTLALAAVLLAARPGWAQPTGQPNPPVPAPEPVLAPGEMRVRAEIQEQVAKGHFALRGTVDLSVAGMRILADQADVHEDPQPDGTLRRRLVASGNVVFLRGEDRIAGDRLEMDDSGHGFLENAVGYVEPGVFLEGRRVERVDDDTYRVEGGRFTSCAQPNPRWGFRASKATIELDDKVVAKNAVFRVKGVPVFYAPWIYYPIQSDGRSTGFLFPHFGHSSKGYEVGTGFFWAMGRSLDQTFYADSFSRIGYGFGHELRYMQASPSRGTFRTYLLGVTEKDLVTDPDTGQVQSGRPSSTEYDIDWNALQVLPGKVKATVNVRKYSDILFQQRFQDDFNRASNRTERFSGSLEKDFRLALLSASADTTSFYFGTDYRRVSGKLPGVHLRRFPRQLGWGGVVVGLEAAAERIRYGDAERVDTWTRYDVAPTVSRPFNLSFLGLNPSVGYRYTRYGASYAANEDGQNEIIGPPLNRSFFEAQVEMRGPTFSRVFDAPGFGYSERFKHVIGPEVSWTYRTRVENFNSIPKSNEDDRTLFGAHEIVYSLVQRFYAKRRGPSGKSQPYEFFNWRLRQTYYVEIGEGQDDNDPNYSSSNFGPGGGTEHLSPLQSRMRFRPVPDFSVDFLVEYNVNFKQVRRTSVSGNLGTSRMQVNGGWVRSVSLSEDVARRKVTSHTLRGNAALEVFENRLFVEGSADYDLRNDVLWQMRGQLRYAVQCCGFVVEHIRYNWNGRDDKKWRFQLELANIGSTRSFLGVDPTGQRAYR